MDLKYIELLVKRCTDLENNKVLFINYNKEIRFFIDKLIDYVKDMGVEDIYLDEEDQYEIHNYLINHSVEEIRNGNYFDKSIWDVYASKGASFLMFETEIPNLMSDVPALKLSLASYLKRNSKPKYRKLQEQCKLSWCICAYPGEEWGRDLFPDDGDSYDKLKRCIFKMCMVDKDDPCLEWDKLLERNRLVEEKLNSLNLEKLHYYNGLGTDLEIYLPCGYLYSSAKDPKAIVNMPSYEVFTSPDFRKANGIVYASKPLSYNGGLIDGFWIRFKDGKVVEYDAKVGKDLLGEIINTDSNSCYLGEAAFVEWNSPINEMGINFKTTLIDENASCHLALGAGFGECLSNGLDMSEEELLEHNVNVSKQHVDFMIGTRDLSIKGFTRDGKEISIFDDGNFSGSLLEK